MDLDISLLQNLGRSAHRFTVGPAFKVNLYFLVLSLEHDEQIHETKRDEEIRGDPRGFEYRRLAIATFLALKHASHLTDRFIMFEVCFVVFEMQQQYFNFFFRTSREGAYMQDGKSQTLLD